MTDHGCGQGERMLSRKYLRQIVRVAHRNAEIPRTLQEKNGSSILSNWQYVLSLLHSRRPQVALLCFVLPLLAASDRAPL